jgi:hypothetical protein
VTLPPSVFQQTSDDLFSFRYEVEIVVGTLVGGTPTNAHVAEGWIRTKMGLTTEELIQAEVERVMEARGVTAEEALEKVSRDRHLSGFKRDPSTPLSREAQKKATTTGFLFEGERKIFTPEQARATFGELYLEGRQLAAMFKEALMIAVGAGHIDATKWGKTSKGAKGFFVEHCFVEDDVVHLGVTEPDEIVQGFVHTYRGTGIKLEERVKDVRLKFTIITDFDFEARMRNFFAILFSIAEKNGLGASRSQGWGRFSTVRFERVQSDPATTKRAGARVAKIRAEAALLAAERGVTVDA